LPSPDRLEPPSPLEDRDDHPEGGARREQVHHGRRQGDGDAAERQHQQQSAQKNDDQDEEGQLAAEDIGEVDEDRRLAADLNAQLRAALGIRDHVRPKVLDQRCGV